MKQLLLKTTLFTALNLYMIWQLEATVITVDNKPKSAAQYTDLQTAINEASAGDTLYIAGSPTSYGSITITKKLALIGAGYKVDNQWGLSTTIENLQIEQGLDEFNNPESDPSGTSIAGLNFYTITIDHGGNHLIERCGGDQIRTHNLASGATKTLSLTVRNVILQYIGFGNDIATATVQNSIILGGVYTANPSSDVLIDHCLFIDNPIEWSDLKYAVITNSIAFSVSTAGAEFCTFSNNISIGGTETAFIYGTNTGGSNLPNTNPQFRTIDGNTFSYTDDFRLQEGSPAIGAASDGTDIGIYGGNFPFPIGGEGEFLMAAPPKIPQIYEMDIQNATVPQNGTLNVNLKARKQD